MADSSSENFAPCSIGSTPLLPWRLAADCSRQAPGSVRCAASGTFCKARAVALSLVFPDNDPLLDGELKALRAYPDFRPEIDRDAVASADRGTPRVATMRVIPVAGRDSMLLNLSGAHGPFFTRNLAILGAPQCNLYISGDALYGMTNVLGLANWTVPLPNLPGFTFYNQAIVFDFSANPLGITTSNGGHGVVAYWYGKNSAMALWGSGPAFGMDPKDLGFGLELVSARNVLEAAAQFTGKGGHLTVEVMREAGAKVLALHAGKTVLLDADRLVKELGADDPGVRLAAATGLALIMSCGLMSSLSASVRRSLTARSTRTSPMRNATSAISPTQRTRRLPRWSMSSISPRPLRSSTRILTTSRMSSLVSVIGPSGASRPTRALNFMRPTRERS